MLTIIPYEVKPSQINKEHKNLYKEICQQKLKKMTLYPILRIVRAPSKRKSSSQDYKYESKNESKVFKKDKN